LTRVAERAVERVREMVGGGIHPLEWPAIAEALRACRSKSDTEKANELDRAARAYEAGDLDVSLGSYMCAFFTKEGEGDAFESFLTKAAVKRHPHLVDLFAAEAARLTALREKR